ncbi:MAG: GldG family protein [Sandaracinaceae bacterium]
MATENDQTTTAERGPEARRPAPEPGRGRRQGAESILFLVIVAAVLVLANVFAYFQFARLDVTSARRHSLSQGSRNLVSNLEETMEIRAYFTADLPPPFNATEQYVRNLLQEYAAASGGKIRLRIIDPDTQDEREEAEEDGVQEVSHQDFQNDSISIKTGYRGIALSYLGQVETIPVVRDTQGLEYELTQKIRLMTRDPLPIGVLSGHESPTPTKGLASLRSALPGYELREVNGAREIDTEIRALLVIDPKDALTETELRRIDQYVMRGGSLGIFGGGMTVELEGGVTARPSGSNLNTLLQPWGVRIEENVILDQICERVPYQTPRGFRIPLKFPPAPIIRFSDEQQEHPALFRINQAPVLFVSELTTTEAFRGLDGQVLGRASEYGWTVEGDSIALQPRERWRIPETTGGQATMVALEGQLPSAFSSAMSGEGDDQGIEAPASAERDVRVFVSGASSMMTDQFNPPPQPGQPPRMSAPLALALNVVDWLAQDQDLIAIRAKNIEDPILETPESIRREAEEAIEDAQAEAEASGEAPEVAAEQLREAAEEAIEERDAALARRKALYRWGLTFGPALAFALFGVLWWQLRRRKRQALRAHPAAGRRAPAAT